MAPLETACLWWDSIPWPWGLKPRYITTLATEARLISIRFPSLIYLSYSQGFALASDSRSTLAFCWCEKPHFGASNISLTSSPELHLVARRPVMPPLFSPLAFGASVRIGSPVRLDHMVYLRVSFPLLWLVQLGSHAWMKLCSWTCAFILELYLKDRMNYPLNI